MTTVITRASLPRCSRRRAAAGRTRRLVVAFQPHRYRRTRDLLDDFANVLAEADVLVLTDVYPAGEAPIAARTAARSRARCARAERSTRC